MADHDTAQRVDSPAILLVGLSPDIEGACVQVLLNSGLRILKSRHAAQACERVAVMMPKIIVASLALPDREADPLVERGVAVGAKMVWIEPGIDLEVLRARLVREAATVLGV